MTKTSEYGGVACGICSVSLQQASFGFGVADVTHGIVGIAVVTAMIIKKENDEIHEKEKLQSDEKMSGYTRFVKECPSWILHVVLVAFILQIFLGIILCYGSSHRSFILCTFWGISSLLASPVTPMTYCLLGLGRMYEWIVVGEWMVKLEKEEMEMQYQKEDKYQEKGELLHMDNDNHN